MSSVAERSLTIARLEKTLRAVDRDVLLVRPRLLQRIIRKDGELPAFGMRVPHRKTYVIDRDRLLKYCSLSELELTSTSKVPAKAVLLARPALELTAARSGETLLRYWRLLFHASVHKQLESKDAQARLSHSAMRARIQRIGKTRFEEIRHVLREEKFLIRPGDDRAVYVEFAAFYLELRYFARELVVHYFPSIQDTEAIDSLLSEDLDFASLFERCRPLGTPDPIHRDGSPVTEADKGTLSSGDFRLVDRLAPVSEDERRDYLQRASKASGQGNSVRALIMRTRVALAENETVTRFGTGDELDQFVDRLQRALHFADSKRNRWRMCLRALLACATQGTFPVEARLLYDLQRACLDVERMVYSDVVDWITGLGRRAYRRPLPLHGLVQQVKHLRSAERRARVARLPELVRGDILELLEAQIEHTEERVCDSIRPILAEALDKVGLQPANLPERLARTKLIEELLDRIVERGYFAMADLRDAIARNRLKLPDLRGFRELIGGDALLRLNRQLADSLPAIYRPGEIYLRGLQRATSLSFGNVPGRLLTLFFLLPFVGAFVCLYGAQFLLEEGLDLVHKSRASVEHLASVDTETEASDDEGPTETPTTQNGSEHEVAIPPPHHHIHLMPPFRLPMHERDLAPMLLQTAVFGVFLFGLIHWRGFRRLVWGAICSLGILLWRLTFEWPGKLLRCPPVRAIFESRPVVLFRVHVMRPLLVVLVTVLILYAGRYVQPPEPRGGLRTVLAGVILAWHDLGVRDIAIFATFVFVTAWLYTHSRLGRTIEQWLLDQLSNFWQAIRMDLIPGLLRWILAIYQNVMSLVEKLLYAVDEWLRFRAGDSRLALVYKPVLGLVWFAIAYVIRFTMNLVVEPQVNPIKHFPVVTVSHKFIFPFALLAHKEIESALSGGEAGASSATFRAVRLGRMLRHFSPKTIAGVVGLGIQFIIPGICGYFAWELRANWRLYRKNQSPTLDPVSIGHHGETMLRFIRPGLHSGTVPKLHARIRKAVRRGRWASFNKRRAELHHVEESIRYFVQRELVALLLGSRGWRGLPVEVGRIHLGSNNIEIELQAGSAERPGLRIGFEQQSGWLVAGIAELGWASDLDGEQHAILLNALAGFYKLCGVDLVREQVDGFFHPHKLDWIADVHGLVVWPSTGEEARATYLLVRDGTVRPHITGKPATKFPEVEASRILYSARPIAWDSWVETWTRDQAGNGVRPLVTAQIFPG